MKLPNSRTVHIVLENRAAAGRDRGIALITTLMLLALLGSASIAITLLVSSDTMINGYYRSYRGSFYAADSGVTVVSEVMKNAIYAAANTTNSPLGAGAVPASVTAAYAPFQSNFTKIGDSGSWNSQFKLISATPISTAAFLPGATAFCSADTPANLTANINVTCNYVYPYDIVVQGISSGNENEEIEEKGSIVYSSFSGAPATAGLPSFSKWGAFITNFPGCSSSPGGLVPGTVNGPSFTDTQWDFGNYSNPGYTFNGSIGQVASQPDWISSNGNCTSAASPPSGFTAPKYNAGSLATSQNTIAAPTDSYSQAQAVLDGVGGETTAAAFQAEASSELKTLSGTTYAASGTPANGVYIPTYMNGTTAEYGSSGGAGGGFYIQGNASVALSATTDSSNNPTQTYTISQTSGFTTTTTTIVVDVAKNTTTVSTGSGHSLVSETLTGIPSQPGVTEDDPSGTAVTPTMVYVNGTITGLSGTVQNDVGITITSADNIAITGNLTYASQPVTTPADTLVSNTNAGVLGVYTTGDIDLSPSGSSLTTDASLAAISGQAVGTGTSGFCTSSSSSSCSANESDFTWTIMGGRAEDQAHSVNLSSSTTYYDQRFSSGTFGPPWFPTAQPQPGAPSVAGSSGVTVSRTSWAELNRQ